MAGWKNNDGGRRKNNKIQDTVIIFTVDHPCQTLLLSKLGHSKILPDLELLKSYKFESPVKYLRRTIH